MLAIRTSAGVSRYGPAGEGDAVFTTVRQGRPPLIWCHGNFGTAEADYSTYRWELQQLAQRYTVCVADLGYNTFGNPTGITRVEQAVAYLAATWGATGPVTLVGASMGAAVELNYARVHPENVAAVACIIPAVDLNVPDAHPAAASIDAAYPPAYDPGNPTMTAHSPVLFASSLPADMPIHLWTSSNDTTVLPATADAFVAARPTTGRTDIGAHGHGGIDVAVPLVCSWLASL